MGGLNRTLVITTLSLRTLRQRAGASAVAVVGVAGVVLVFVAVLSIAEGFQAALAGAGSPDTAIILRGGRDSELGSALALADTRIIKDAAGVRRADGGPVASAELFVVVDLLKRSTGTVANLPLLGRQLRRLASEKGGMVQEGDNFDDRRAKQKEGPGVLLSWAILA